MFHECGRIRYDHYQRLPGRQPVELLEERCLQGELPRYELEQTVQFLKAPGLPAPGRCPILPPVQALSREK